MPEPSLNTPQQPTGVQYATPITESIVQSVHQPISQLPEGSPYVEKYTPKGTQGISNLYSYLKNVEQMEGLPSTAEEFKANLNDSTLNNLYNYLRDVTKLEGLPETIDSFKDELGFVTIPAVGDKPARTVPADALDRMDPMRKLLSDGLQGILEESAKLPTTSTRKVAGTPVEYASTLVSKFNSSVTNTLDMLADWYDEFTFLALNPETIKYNPFKPLPKEYEDRLNLQKEMGKLGMGVVPGVPMTANPVRMLANLAHKGSDTDMELPDDIVSEIAGNAMAISGDLVQLALAPEVKAPTYLSKLGLKTLPKFPAYLGTKEAYHESTVGGNPLEGFAVGVAEGVQFEMLGGLGGKLSRNLTRSIGVKSAVGTTTMDALSTSGVFFGDGVIREAADITLGDRTLDSFSLRPAVVNAGIGLAFGVKPILEGSTTDFYRMRAADVAAKKVANWMSTTDNTIRKVGNNTMDMTVLREKSDNLGERISKIRVDDPVKTRLMAEKNVYDNLLSLQAQSMEIVQNPDRFRKAIMDDISMPPAAKQFFLNKVEATLDAFDPVRKRMQEVEKSVQDRMAELEQLKAKQQETPDNLRVVAEMEALQEGITSSKKELKSLFSDPQYYIGDRKVNSASEIVAEIGKMDSVTDLMRVVVRNDRGLSKQVEDRIIKVTEDNIRKGTMEGEMDVMDMRVTETLTSMGKSSDTPVVIVPDNVVSTINRADRNGVVTKKELEDARTYLQEEYSRVERLRGSDNPLVKRYTDEQYGKALDFILNELKAVDSYVAERGGNRSDFIAGVETRRSAEASQVPTPEGVKPTEPVKAGDAERGGAAGGGEQGTKLPRSIVDGVHEMGAALQGSTFNGKAPSMDNAVRSITEGLVERFPGKSPDFYRGQVREAMFALTDNASMRKRIDEQLNIRKDIIRDTVSRKAMDAQPMEPTVVSRAGRSPEVVEKPSELREIRESERAYREELRKQRKTSSEGDIKTSGIGDKDLDYLSRMAMSYVREGLNSTKSIVDRIKAESQDVLGQKMKRDDIDRVMSTAPEGEKLSPAELLSIHEEVKARMKPIPAKTKEQKAIEKATGVKSEKDKLVVDEMSALKTQIKLRDKAAKESKRATEQHYAEVRKDFVDFVSKLSSSEYVGSTISKMTPETAMRGYTLKLAASIKDSESLARAMNEVMGIANRHYTVTELQNFKANREKVKRGIKSGKYGRNTGLVQAVLDIPVQSKKGTGDAVALDAKDFPSLKDQTVWSRNYDFFVGNIRSREQFERLQDITAKLAKGSLADVPVSDLMDMAYRHRESIETVIAKRANQRDKLMDVQSVEEARTLEKERTWRWMKVGLSPDNIGKMATMFNSHELRVIKELSGITKPELEALTTRQLGKLRDYVDMLESGWVSNKLYEEVIRPVREQRRMDELSKDYFWARAESIGKFKDTQKYKETVNLMEELENVKGVKSAKDIFNKLKKVPLDDIDMVLGAEGNTPIFKTIHHPMNVAFSQAKFMEEGILHELTRHLKAVNRDRGSDLTSRFDSNVLMSMYRMERMYIANGMNNRLGKSIDTYVANILESPVDVASKKRIVELHNSLPRTAEGNVDISRMYNEVLTPSERRLVEFMDKTYSETLAPMLKFSTEVYRGERFEWVEDYTPLVVEKNTDRMVEGIIGSDAFSRLSTQSGSAKARTGSRVVRFDAVNAFIDHVRQTAVDYHLTPVVKETFGTLSKLHKQHTTSGNVKAVEFIKGLENTYYNAVSMEFASAFGDTGTTARVINMVMRNSYNSTLASVRRVPAETMSNIMSAMTYDPVSLITGLKYMTGIGGEKYRDFLYWVGTGHAQRMGSHTDEYQRLYSSDFEAVADNLSPSIGKRSMDWMESNRLARMSKEFNTSLVRMSDNMVTRPYWTGKFHTEFKKRVGQEFSIDQFNSDMSYRDRYERDIRDAALAADYSTTMLYNSAQSFDRALSTKVNPADRLYVLKMMNNFIVGYGRREYYNTVKAMKSMVYGNRPLSRGQGARLLGTIMLRNTVYAMMMDMSRGLITNAVGSVAFNDQKNDEAFMADKYLSEENIPMIVGSTVANVASGRLRGAGRMGMAYLFNYGSKLYNEDVLGREYKPFEHSLMYTKGNIFTDPNNVSNWTGLLGPLSYAANFVYDTGTTSKWMSENWDSVVADIAEGNLTDDTYTAAATMTDWGLQFFNLFGMVPAYRDFKTAASFTERRLKQPEYDIYTPTGEVDTKKLDELVARMRKKADITLQREKKKNKK